jgi:methylated-DNA-[protein]-cysteine S-methyltransferase
MKSGTKRASDGRDIHVFNTPIGRCALEWGPGGIRRVLLGADVPRRGTERAEAPAAIRSAADRITAHLAGCPDALRDLAVDLSRASEFTRAVYRTLRRVEPGEVVTYGELARRAGRPGASRAVGRAMATNPVPLIVPCHRVLPANGGVGQYGAGGPAVKARLLRIEGAELER